MPTVAIFRSELLPASETFVRAQATSLSRWTPVFVGNCRVAGGLDLSPIPVRLLREDSHDFWRNTMHSVDFWLGRASASSARALRDTGASLVHAHFATDAVDLWPAVRRARLPLLVTLHGYDVTMRPEWWHSGKGGLRRRVYPRRLLDMARQPGVAFVAVSQALKERAVDLGIAPEKITVAYIGVDTRRFVPGDVPLSARAPRVLFIGRLVEKKGLPVLIRAMQRVMQALPSAELVVAGDGPQRATATRLANEARLNATFVGALDERGVLEQLHQAQVTCLPSIEAANGDAEGFGLVLLESQACGVPVVTSALGGAREGLLEGRTGHAFAPGDDASLAAHLVRMLSDPAGLDAMSSAARRFVCENFELRQRTAALEEHYDRLAREQA